MNSMTRGKRILLTLWVLVIAPLSMALPMTYGDERQIARDFTNLLEANNLIIHDSEIALPVQMIADLLADHIKDPVYNFKLHVVRDLSVNAFAIPDGHIFINVGALLFVDDLDEISAVIAHEMGHSQLRHIPENYNTQKSISAATILGVLAGTLLSSRSPEAGAAMIFSSIGGSENIRLAYSRKHEYEADNYGKGLLAASGIEPSAMSRFLIRLNAYSGSSGIPEYLLTHPYTENRISNMRGDPGKPRPNNDFWALYASVLGLGMSGGDIATRTARVPEPYKSLAIALSLTRSGNHARALAMLEKIDLSVAKAYRGLNLYELGRKDEAYPFLKDHARSARTKIALAQILQDRGNYAEAIDLLVPFQSQNLRVDHTLGVLYEKVKKPELSHVSFARYFFKTNNYVSCRYHIEKALETKDSLPKEVLDELKVMKDLAKNPQ